MWNKDPRRKVHSFNEGKKKKKKSGTRRHFGTKGERDAAKAVLRGKFTATQAHLRKQEKSQINNLTLYLKQPEREQTKPKVSRRKEFIKIREEINEI